MYLTDFPRFVPVSAYDLAIERMVGKLRQQDGVVSIFRLGSINSPGISDIDILVVFEDGVKCSLNPLKDLSKIECYLFSHNLYGISKTNFFDAQRYTFFHDYNLLWGDQLPFGQSDLSCEEMQALKTQTALEYLIKMYINCTIEYTYGIVRMRGLLVLTKALLYDLEFLNVSSGRLFDLIQILILWRNQWFKEKPDKQDLKIWIREFYEELTAFLKTMLHTKTFYLPEWANLCVARNMTLVPSKKFGYTHKGITLPAILGGLGRKYFNVQHRFNTFRFRIPITISNVPDILLKRFEFAMKMKRANGEHLANFMPLTSSLNIFS